MSEKRPDKEELTTAMHSEFTVSEETDRKHRTFAALKEIRYGIFPRERTLQSFDITEEDIAKYEPEWIKLLG